MSCSLRNKPALETYSRQDYIPAQPLQLSPSVSHSMDSYNDIVRTRITRLQNLLEQQCQYKSNPWKRERAQSIAHFRGVRIAGIRVAVHVWNQEWRAQCPEIPAQHRIDIALRLFHSGYLEDKLSSIIFIDEVLFNENAVQSYLMTAFSELFEAGLMSCYEVSDSFSTKVLTGLLIRERQAMMQIISQWFRSSYVWKARSALNALIPLAKDAIYESLILEGCALVLPKRDECAKSVVASALRAMSYGSPNTVYAFLSNERNLALMTGPGLTKACGNHQDWKNILRRKRREICLQNFNCDFSADIEQEIGNMDNRPNTDGTTHDIGYYAHPPLVSQPLHSRPRASQSSPPLFPTRSVMADGSYVYLPDHPTTDATQMEQIDQVYPSGEDNQFVYISINSAQGNNHDEATFSNGDAKRKLPSSNPVGRGK